MKVSILRLLREKHRLSRAELSRACGISKQRIYELEMLIDSPRRETKEKVVLGMDALILQRQAELDTLCMDFMKHRDSILDRVEETAYEL